MRNLGLFFDEREIHLAFPAYHVRKADHMILLNGIGTGGSTTISTGNALRMDGDLKELGIDLEAEFAEIFSEIPVTTAHERGWRKPTRRMFSIFEQQGLRPQPTPKMGEYERCAHCGRCQLGCPFGVKWDSRRFLEVAVNRGAEVIEGCSVRSVAIEDGRALGVWVEDHWTRNFIPADLVVLAAGGFATPLILERSGIACEPNLFVDPVLCVAARSPHCRLHREVAMPFISTADHIILSPYFDHLSFFFNRQWRLPVDDIVSIMIKLSDERVGSISNRGVDKMLTAQDRSHLDNGVSVCKEILQRFGASENEMFLGTVIAGHPGGMLPLTANESTTLHSDRLPNNLYVADATLLPKSLGNPPILTIIALAKRIARLCLEL